jgi:hypothetical protein
MRARNLKPSFFDNENLAECPPLARLLFAGLWCLADREGRFEWRPKRIKVKVLPYDDCNVDDLLKALSNKGFIEYYAINGNEYGCIPCFSKHQYPHVKEKDSTIPAPEKHSTSTVQKRLNPESLILNPESLKKPEGYALPSQEEIAEASIPKVKSDIQKACKDLYERDIFPKANAFANKCLKHNYNPRAVLHTLTRVSLAKPKQPWAYAVKIMKVEDGNFNERDFIKAT